MLWTIIVIFGSLSQIRYNFLSLPWFAQSIPSPLLLPQYCHRHISLPSTTYSHLNFVAEKIRLSWSWTNQVGERESPLGSHQLQCWTTKQSTPVSWQYWKNENYDGFSNEQKWSHVLRSTDRTSSSDEIQVRWAIRFSFWELRLARVAEVGWLSASAK